MIPDLTVVPSASTRHLIVLEAAAAAVVVATEAAATDVEAAVAATTAAVAAVSLRSIPINDLHPWLINALLWWRSWCDTSLIIMIC